MFDLQTWFIIGLTLAVVFLGWAVYRLACLVAGLLDQADDLEAAQERMGVVLLFVAAETPSEKVQHYLADAKAGKVETL